MGECHEEKLMRLQGPHSLDVNFALWIGEFLRGNTRLFSCSLELSLGAFFRRGFGGRRRRMDGVAGF